MNFTDLNGHLLPEINHKITNIDETLEVIKKINNIGVETIVETPNSSFVENYSASKIEEKIDEITSLLTDLGINNTTLLVGMENNFDKELPHLISEKIAITINYTKFITIKFPFWGLPNNFGDTLRLINFMGFTPILLNVENNNYFQKKPNQLNELIQENCLIQLSSSSLLSTSPIKVRDFSQFIISKNNVHLVSGFVNYEASMIEQNLKETTDFIENISGEKTVESLMSINPKLIAFGNEPNIEIEEIRPSKFKMFISYSFKKLPTVLEFFHWKLLIIIKFFKRLINHNKF
jgi:protein-tyrosine phosphatase